MSALRYYDLQRRGPLLPLASTVDASVYRCAWHELPVNDCDALIVDAPYSDRTHAGHADGAQTANRAQDWQRRNPERDAWGNKVKGSRGWQSRYIASGKGERRKINYAAWSEADVIAFVEHWSSRVRGWIVTITDHVLAPVWSAALEAAGRYVFTPLPYVAPGSRVRMTGDGPPAWTCWIVVARPRSEPWNKWATEEARKARGAEPLPGWYALPKGYAEDMEIVGGKPLWLMRSLVLDYSAPGDLIVDPCCGAGTTLRAAQEEGRRGIGCDVDPAHAKIAARRILAPVNARLPLSASARAEQTSIAWGEP